VIAPDWRTSSRQAGPAPLQVRRKLAAAAALRATACSGCHATHPSDKGQRDPGATL